MPGDLKRSLRVFRTRAARITADHSTALIFPQPAPTRNRHIGLAESHAVAGRLRFRQVP
ncbi:MAG TPA: hypothetical protein VMT51_11965 [Dongiaceae bacterium]|nr:hypothetical protein [Dongiaceae bacterium]